MVRKAKGQEVGPYTNDAVKNRLKGKWVNGSAQKEKMHADWNAISPVVLHSLVCAVASLGGAVTVGVDKQGAGFTVTAWLGGEKVLNQWFRGDAEGIEALHFQLEEFVTDVYQGD